MKKALKMGLLFGLCFAAPALSHPAPEDSQESMRQLCPPSSAPLFEELDGSCPCNPAEDMDCRPEYCYGYKDKLQS